MRKPSRHRGFVLAAVLVTSGLGALLVLDALTGAALAQAAVTRLRLRHETFEAAEAALALLTARIADPRSTVSSDPGVEGVVVQAAARRMATEAAPDDFSAARFRVEHFDLEAEATAARGSRLALRAGVSRWTAEP